MSARVNASPADGPPMFWVLIRRSSGKCHIVSVWVMMPRKAVLPLRPLCTVTGTVWVPRRTVRCTTAWGARLTTA